MVTSYVDWAFSIKTIDASEQLVLLRLAHYADKLKVCRPSINRLVEETKLSRSTVFRVLGSLEDREIILRWKGAQTTIYTLMKRDVKQSHPDMGGLTVTPELPASSNRYFHPSDERASGPKNTTSKKSTKKVRPAKTESTVVKVNQSRAQRERLEARGVSPEITRATGPVKVSKQQFSTLLQALRSRKDSSMAMPGFEDDKPTQIKKRRAQVDDFVGGGAGQLPEELEAKAQKKASKKTRRRDIVPVAKWNSRDFVGLMQDLAKKRTPYWYDQITVGWALKDFSRWMETTDREVIKAVIEEFYGNDRNFLKTTDNYTIWQKFRIYYLGHFEATQKRVEQAARERSTVTEAPAAIDPRLQELAALAMEA